MSKTTFDILLFLCFNPFILFASDVSTDAILDSMTSVMQPESSKGKMEQEIITSNHEKRVFTFEYFLYLSRILSDCVVKINSVFGLVFISFCNKGLKKPEIPVLLDKSLASTIIFLIQKLLSQLNFHQR